MVKHDYHIHSNFSDGNNTPEEMVKAAIELGLTSIGFSDHGFVPHDDCCMTEAQIEPYKAEINRLKDAYKGKIDIKLGIEFDAFTTEPREDYDYIIGSVHYVKVNGEYYCIDYKPETIVACAEENFGGDYYKVCDCYFETVGNIVETTGCKIVGHLDQIAKLNDRCKFFDENDERYINAWKKACDKLVETGAIIEINTGGIARGYRTVPYPAPNIVSYLAERGAKFILSSDSHSTDNIAYKFEEMEAMFGDKIELVDL